MTIYQVYETMIALADEERRKKWPPICDISLSF